MISRGPFATARVHADVSQTGVLAVPGLWRISAAVNSFGRIYAMGVTVDTMREMRVCWWGFRALGRLSRHGRFFFSVNAPQHPELHTSCTQLRFCWSGSAPGSVWFQDIVGSCLAT